MGALDPYPYLAGYVVDFVDLLRIRPDPYPLDLVAVWISARCRFYTEMFSSMRLSMRGFLAFDI